jgi:hypothetical protein
MVTAPVIRASGGDMYGEHHKSIRIAGVVYRTPGVD